MKDFMKNGVRNQRTVLLRSVRKNAVRKERRRHSIQRIVRVTAAAVLGAGLVSVAILGGYTLLTSPLFIVKNIAVDGNTHLSEESLRIYEERLASNIFRLNLDKVRQDLLQEPYVSQAFLRRELPDRIYIRIEERTPYAVLEMKKEAVLVDQHGRILGAVKKTDKADLPVITGIDRNAEGAWKEDLIQALSLVETIKNYGYPDLIDIQKIEMTRQLGAVLYSVAGEFEVRFGRGDFLHKMILLKRVTADLVRREWPVKHIDLRFQDQVVVGLGKIA
jgi:cell division protein FtsQ